MTEQRRKLFFFQKNVEATLFRFGWLVLLRHESLHQDDLFSPIRSCILSSQERQMSDYVENLVSSNDSDRETVVLGVIYWHSHG